MTIAQRGGIDGRALVAAVVLGTIGALTIMVVPGFVTLVAAQSGLGDRELGFIASWDISTMAAAIGVSTWLISRFQWRHIALVGTALMVLGDLSTAASQSYAAIASARVCAGCGEGLAVAISFAALGRATNPDRAFGIYLIVGLAVSAAVLALLPALQASIGPPAVFVGAAGLTVASATLYSWLPDRNRERGGERGSATVVLKELAITGLVGVFLYFIAQGALWSYFERIGAASGIRPDLIGYATGVSSFAGVGGALLAVWGCMRLGRTALLMGSGVLSIASFWMLRGHVTETELVISGLLFNFGWNLAQPLLSGVCADADSEGRVVVAMGCIQTVGFGLGPAIAASLLRDGEFLPVIWLSSAVVVVSLLIVLSGLHAQRRRAAALQIGGL